MSSVLVVNEISTEREEMTRALEAEGFTVVQAASAAEAVREIWGGNFLVAIIPTLLTDTTSTSLQQQLVQMAPEIETLIHGKNDELPALVRKGIRIRDGEAAGGAAERQRGGESGSPAAATRASSSKLIVRAVEPRRERLDHAQRDLRPR